MVELAITVDAGEPFVKATYFLEGDGPLVFSCYEKILALKAFVNTAFSNAVIDSLAKGNATVQQQLTHYASQCVKLGYDLIFPLSSQWTVFHFLVASLPL